MWKTITSKEIFSHPRITLIEDEVLLPNGHKTNYLKYKDDNSNVTIITKKDDKILIQKEYSYPSNQKLFQFPGGSTHEGETPEIWANRELMEEAWYRANKLELLGSYLTNNRRSTKKMFVYLATDLIEESLEWDIEEDIESFWLSEDEITRIIRNGEIINNNLLASWCLYVSGSK